MQYCSMVLRCAPLFWCCSICVVSWMGPKECVCSVRCLAQFEFWLFVLNVALRSLNLVKKFLPVCPTYTLLQSGQLSLYTPDCVYLSVLFVTCFLFTSIFWVELLVCIAIFRSACLNKFVVQIFLFSYVSKRSPFLCRFGFWFCQRRW